MPVDTQSYPSFAYQAACSLSLPRPSLSSDTARFNPPLVSYFCSYGSHFACLPCLVTGSSLFFRLVHVFRERRDQRNRLIKFLHQNKHMPLAQLQQSHAGSAGSPSPEPQIRNSTHTHTHTIPLSQKHGAPLSTSSDPTPTAEKRYETYVAGETKTEHRNADIVSSGPSIPDSEVPSEEEQLLSLSKGLVLAEEIPALASLAPLRHRSGQRCGKKKEKICRDRLLLFACHGKRARSLPPSFSLSALARSHARSLCEFVCVLSRL